MYDMSWNSNTKHKGQCTTLVLRCPPPPIFSFLHPNQLSDPPPPLFSSSTILIVGMQLCHCCHFPIFFCCNHFYWNFFISAIYCSSPPHILFLFAPGLALCCMSPPPCHRAYLYVAFDCSCIVNTIQPPTKCLFPQLFLFCCIPAFLQLVIASFVLLSSSSP